MSRITPPNRRPNETFRFEHDGNRYFATVSYSMVNGSPCEVFLTAGKVGSSLDAMARDAAVVTSLALQHGTSLTTLRAAMTRLDDGNPAGPMGALLDLVEGA